MNDFLKNFPGSIWHSAVAVFVTVLVAVLLLMGVNAIKNAPNRAKDPVTSSTVTNSAINAELEKIASEATESVVSE